MSLRSLLNPCSLFHRNYSFFLFVQFMFSCVLIVFKVYDNVPCTTHLSIFILNNVFLQNTWKIDRTTLHSLQSLMRYKSKKWHESIKVLHVYTLVFCRVFFFFFLIYCISSCVSVGWVLACACFRFQSIFFIKLYLYHWWL